MTDSGNNVPMQGMPPFASGRPHSPFAAMMGGRMAQQQPAAPQTPTATSPNWTGSPIGAVFARLFGGR